MTSLAPWCNSGVNIIGVTNHFLTTSKVCSTRWNPYPAQLMRQRTVARQVFVLKGEFTIVILLNGLSVKTIPGNLCYCHRSVYLPTLSRKTACGRWQLMQKPIPGQHIENKTAECSALSETPAAYLSPKVRDLHEIGAGRPL